MSCFVKMSVKLLLRRIPQLVSVQSERRWVRCGEIFPKTRKTSIVSKYLYIYNMLLYIVGVGAILYTLPYVCLKIVFKERRRRGISPRGSTISLRETPDNKVDASGC